MKKILYTIADSVSRTYWQPFAAHNDADAKRAMTNAVNQPGDNDLYLHPEDFHLYRVGFFNDEFDNLIIEPLIPIEMVCRLDSLMAHHTDKQEDKNNG